VPLDEFVADLRGRAERRELWPYAEEAAEATTAAS
jgi:hypothetical protein